MELVPTFLTHLSKIMEPLQQLTRLDPKTDKLVDFVWTGEHENAFLNIKKVVSNAPVLAYYDPKEEFEIQCDASDKGIGAVLLQKGRPIAYISKALADAQTRSTIIEKEMLAIVASLKRPVTVV